MANIKPSKKKSNKPEIVAIGTEDTGYFYFQKLGYLKSGEILEVTKYEATKKQGSSAINVIIGGIAKGKDISRELASEYIFGKEVDGLRVFPPDQESVLMEYSEELAELNKLQIPTLEIRNFVATLLLSGFYAGDDFVPGRVASQIELLSEVKVNDECILIEPLFTPLANGSTIKFGEVVLRVSGHHPAEAEEIKIEKSPGTIAANTTGFFYDTVKNKYYFGSESWTHADTAELPQELIEAIYDFYQSEAGKDKEIVTTEESLAEGKSQTPLEEVQELDQKTSTGMTVISESKNTKSKTPALVAG